MKSTNATKTTNESKLPIIRNWTARNSGEPKIQVHEYPIYTDSRLTGEVVKQDWPYKFLNTVPLIDAPGIIQAALILRIDFHAVSERPDFSKTNTTFYHGGLITDELAALASLCTGVRMKAGGLSRRFEEESNDPLGRPVAWDRRPIPFLSIEKNKLVLPEVVGTASLNELSRLDSLLHITSSQSIAIVRCARLYQDATWLAESEPALAWLLFVSALETAANQWKTEQGTAPERLEYARPDLYKVLLESGGSSLIDKVAEQIESSLGATKKFIDFTLTHLPDAPTKRPDKSLQIQWEAEPMKKMLGLIYSYRSKALHGGTPFPAPMSAAPFQYSLADGYAEVGTVGLAAGSTGGMWQGKDLPMNLHTFHYLVRSTLLKWWDSMVRN